MRNLKLIEHISLDGVIQNTADDDDFPYTDWTGPYRTPEGAAAVLAAHGEDFDLLLGRRTHDLLASYWPQVSENPMADRLNAATKFVVTHRPESLSWAPFESLGANVVEEVRRLKSQDGPDLVLIGSSTLTSTLLEQNLVDEVMLIVYPVLVGTGKRIVASGTPARFLELADTKVMPSGVVLHRYRVAQP